MEDRTCGRILFISPLLFPLPFPESSHNLSLFLLPFFLPPTHQPTYLSLPPPFNFSSFPLLAASTWENYGPVAQCHPLPWAILCSGVRHRPVAMGGWQAQCPLNMPSSSEPAGRGRGAAAAEPCQLFLLPQRASQNIGFLICTTLLYSGSEFFVTSGPKQEVIALLFKLYTGLYLMRPCLYSLAMVLLPL